MKYSTAVIVGRFQPFHHGHAALVRQALAQADRAVIVLGSANSARSIRNPFTASERQSLIEANLSPAELARTRFARVRDYYYNNAAWTSEVIEKTREATDGEGRVGLFGFNKDATSQYLEWFPGWSLEAAVDPTALSATPMREAYLRDVASLASQAGLSEVTKSWLAIFAQSNPAYADLREEQLTIDGYRKQWAASPYPPTFVTTDAIVVQAGHVLLIRRAAAPGKGQWAIPGGFLNPEEWLRDCAIRELREETSLGLDAAALKSALVCTRVFDHPLRSTRGRTITHAHYFKLPGDRLAPVRASDDAAEAKWIPVLDLARLEESLFEDHFQMIETILKNY